MADLSPVDVFGGGSSIMAVTFAPEPCVRERILDAIVLRLQGITIAGGYSMDLASKVFRARQSNAEANLPTASVWDGAESVSEEAYGDTIIDMTIAVEIMIDAGANVDNISPVANRCLSDVIRAMTWASYDRTFGGLTRNIKYTTGSPIYPEDGRRVTGIKAEFTITYSTPIGNPFTATQ